MMAAHHRLERQITKKKKIKKNTKRSRAICLESTNRKVRLAGDEKGEKPGMGGPPKVNVQTQRRLSSRNNGKKKETTVWGFGLQNHRISGKSNEKGAEWLPCQNFGACGGAQGFRLKKVSGGRGSFWKREKGNGFTRGPNEDRVSGECPKLFLQREKVGRLNKPGPSVGQRKGKGNAGVRGGPVGTEKRNIKGRKRGPTTLREKKKGVCRRPEEKVGEGQVLGRTFYKMAKKDCEKAKGFPKKTHKRS